MGWLFLIVAAVAALFALPGGTRSAADRQMAKLAAFVALSISLMAFKMFPLAIPVLVIGGALFGINWFRDHLLGGQYRDIEDDALGGARRTSPYPTGTMSESEALKVLGLTADATSEDVTAAHRRMIARAHPDGGGSNYLASKVNEARDTLLKRG